MLQRVDMFGFVRNLTVNKQQQKTNSYYSIAGNWGILTFT